jgi:hypothetical protein
LEILIALKESHSLLSTSWQKTISDLNRLKKLSAPELIDDDSVSTFLELRKEDCKLRRRSQLSATQWKLLSNLRRNLGHLSVDGSICLLVQDSTFESLSEEEQMEYVKLECTAHLAMLQDPNSKMDLSDLAIFRAQECFVTSENYCEASRYFAVSQNVEMARWMQDFLPSISSRCMASLRDAISESNRSSASQSSYLANTRSSKNTEEAHNEAPELTSIGEIPGDIVMEILSQVLSMNVIARFSLCSRELRRVSLQSSFWRQLSQHTFSSFLTDAKKTNPDVFPNPLTFDWRRFYNACSRAKESAVPNPPSLALLHQYNVTTNASHLLRTEATAIISAFDKVAKEELEFIARWSTVTQYSVKNESDGCDDPAWRHYCVELRVPLPDLRVITISARGRKKISLPPRFHTGKTDDLLLSSSVHRIRRLSNVRQGRFESVGRLERTTRDELRTRGLERGREIFRPETYKAQLLGKLVLFAPNERCGLSRPPIRDLCSSRSLVRNYDHHLPFK